jgi:hypothetical protein
MQIYRLWLAGNDKFCEDDASAENDKNKVLPCVLTSAPLSLLGPNFCCRAAYLSPCVTLSAEQER